MKEYLDNGYVYSYDRISMIWTIHKVDNLSNEYDERPEYYKNKTELLTKYPFLKFTKNK